MARRFRAEEEKDVTTHGEQAAQTDDAATATDKPDEPKVKTAAEIVAENAKKKATDKPADPADKPAVTKTAVTPAVKAAGKPPAKVTAKPAGADKGRGREALTAVGSGVNRVRGWVATVVWLAAVLCAAVLALGALFTVLDQANENNDIVSWVLDRGRDLVGPFEDLFKLKTAKNTLLVNWGIAALAYLVVGKLIERIIRP